MLLLSFCPDPEVSLQTCRGYEFECLLELIGSWVMLGGMCSGRVGASMGRAWF